MPWNAREYRYGLLLNQHKYPVIVHKPTATPGQPKCGRTGGNYQHNQRRGIEVQTRLLDGEHTVYCHLCWGK